MAKFAPVAPPEMIRAVFDAAGPNAVGRYHLLLAHDVAARGTDYARLYPAGSTIIMDNSMVELGHPVDGEVMEAACSIVPPQIIVLPDVRNEADQTVEMSRAYAKDREGSISPHSQQYYMAVPQGGSLEEYVDCARRLAAIPRVQYWGIPRSVVDTLGTRRDLVREINAVANPTKVVKTWTCIHLLGFSTSLEDDLACARLEGVMGIDSAVPLRMGQAGKMMTLTQADPGPRGNWWEDPLLGKPSVDPAVIANLFLIRQWAA